MNKNKKITNKITEKIDSKHSLRYLFLLTPIQRRWKFWSNTGNESNNLFAGISFVESASHLQIVLWNWCRIFSVSQHHNYRFISFIHLTINFLLASWCNWCSYSRNNRFHDRQFSYLHNNYVKKLFFRTWKSSYCIASR